MVRKTPPSKSNRGRMSGRKPDGPKRSRKTPKEDKNNATR